jgi:sterol desaturase/sphingolipid hydroxylase (fatty acid hydroxylase superfamily)
MFRRVFFLNFGGPKVARSHTKNLKRKGERGKMFCEIAEEYGFIAVWVAFTSAGLLSMGLLSTLVFIPLYAKPSMEIWRYKCNPVFPSTLLVKKEIIHTVNGLVVATMIPAFALVVGSSNASGLTTHGYCSKGEPIDWKRMGLETIIIVGFTDLTEYIYHHLGHRFKALWSIHTFCCHCRQMA